MKVLGAFVLALVGGMAPAYAAEIISASPEACSKKINAWGHPSSCVCPVESRYDERIRACVVGADEPIMVSGAIVAGLVAIGAETTGIALQTWETPPMQYELVLKKSDYKKLSRLNGLPFEVVGDFITLPGVELAARPAIIVRELHWLD